MLPARSFSVSIAKNAKALYDLIWPAEYFPNWASGLAESDLRRDGDCWQADGTEGPIQASGQGPKSHRD